MGVAETVDPLSKLSLPPGFRFNPTDEELMVNYLCPKVAGENPPLVVIGDLDLYKHDPWLLPSKALFGEKEWYFFSPRDRKYPNGSRPNRVAGSGYWKATGTDKVIASEGKKVGIKKSLVFYVGKAPTGSKTNWIMHEYRLLEPQRRAGSSKLDDWVLCRIYKKNSSAQRAAGNIGMGRTECSRGSSSSSSSQFDDKRNIQNAGCFSGNNFNWTTFPGLNNTFAGQCGGIQIQSHNQTQHGGMSSMNYNQSNMYPSVDSGYGKMTEQEVQSGFLNQPAHNSGLLYPNAYGGQGFINSIDPYAAMRYQNQPGSSGDRN